MEPRLHPAYQLSGDIEQALRLKQPVVALESTVITHGLPYPQNLALARDMEDEVRNHGAVPATIAVLDGRVLVGALPTQLESLASGMRLDTINRISYPQQALLEQDERVHKLSSRDIGPAIAKGWSGGTTVAGTLLVAHAAGLQVFATGGIGGVHRQAPFDVSADLPQLAKTPMIVVCSGAKAILDLPATLEYLETVGVPVVGYRTEDFPAFYSRSSGLKVHLRAYSPAEVASIARAHWGIGMQSAVLVVNPPPLNVALPLERVEEAIQQALKEARAQKIHGQKVTPFLLARMVELTGGESLAANLGLLRDNARLAAEIAVRLASE